MKKSCLFLLLSVATTLSFAQVSWNIKGGINISDWYGEGCTSEAKTGYKIGTGMEYAFNKMCSLQMSIFLSSKGAKSDAYDSVQTYSKSLKINQVYLELPIMAALRMPMNKNMNIVLSAGPYFAYGIGGKITTEHGGQANKSRDAFGEDEINRVDAGLGCGLAFEFGKFIVGFDGQFGLMVINAKKDAPKNGNFSITLGVNF